MNLVQINERLKDLPMQVLQQYANGMNPEVPPYLALGELQRREISQKQMATAQGGQQGPQPSVKEQVEQKAGLMALQQMQQQQAAQQMQQPRGPMPAPAGVPQPEAQPEAMARGGLAGIPVRRDMFEYAGGGIIAFSGEDGSEVKSKYETKYDRMNRLNREKAAAEKAERLEEIRAAGNETMPYGEQMRNVGRAIDSAVPDPIELIKKLVSAPGYGLSKDEAKTDRAPKAVQTGSPDIPSSPASGIAAALAKAGPAATDRPAPPVAGPAAPPMPGTPRPAAPRPAAPAAGAPAGIAAALPQGNVSPFMAEAAAAAREKPVAPTPESIIAEQKKLLPESMQEDAVKRMIAEQRARAEARQAAYEKSKPSGLDDLIRVYGQAAQYKGGTGLAPAYTSLQQQRRAEDLAMQKQQDELLTAIEGRQYGADEKLFGAREKSLTAAQKSFQDRLMTNTKTLADLAGVDQRRMDEAAQRLTQVELEKMRSATQNRSLNEKLKFESDFLALKAQARDLEAKGDATGAAKLEARANDMLSIRSGASAGVGAGRNAIMERRLEMQNLEKIMKDEGMQYSEEEKKEAAKEYKRLAMMSAKETGGGSAFTVTAGGKTYTFPTQEAANKFKAEAGVK